MQVAFVRNIKKLINMNESKALLNSAKGERDIFMTDAGNLENIRVSAACS